MYNNQFFLELKTQRVNLFEQIKAIDALLKLNGIDLTDDNIDTVSEQPTLVDKSRPYKKGASYQEKIAGLLKQHNRFLSIYEMAIFVQHYEPNLMLEDAKKSLGSAKKLIVKKGNYC